MSQLCRFLGLVAFTLALIVPTMAQDAKQPDPKKDTKKDDADPLKKGDEKKAKEEPKEKLNYSVKVTGKITELDSKQGTDFTLQVKYKVAEPNLDAQRQMLNHQQRIAQLQGDLARARSLQERADRQRDIANVLNQMARTQQDLVRYKDVTQNYKLRLADNAKCRTTQPPLEYDDKGNVKKYTAKELAALRGTSGLPGYTAERDQLQVGQIVDVYVAGAKGAANAKAGPAKGDKAGAKKKMEADELLLVPDRPEIALIVVLQEANR